MMDEALILLVSLLENWNGRRLVHFESLRRLAKVGKWMGRKGGRFHLIFLCNAI